MLQPHGQNLKLSVSVKQIQPCEFQEPLYTQRRILFPKWKITVLTVEMNTDKKNEKKKQNKTQLNMKPNPKFMVPSPLVVQIFPLHQYRNLSKSHKMSSSLLGLHFGCCIQEQYFKHGLRNNSTYEFDENNSGFCKLHRNEGFFFFPPVIAVTCTFNDCVACCLMDASFQRKCFFQITECCCGTSKERKTRIHGGKITENFFCSILVKLLSCVFQFM